MAWGQRCDGLIAVSRRLFGDERHWGCVEQDALRYFLANIGVTESQIERIGFDRTRPSRPTSTTGPGTSSTCPSNSEVPKTLVLQIAAS